jgi:hypothetical protein
VDVGRDAAFLDLLELTADIEMRLQKRASGGDRRAEYEFVHLVSPHLFRLVSDWVDVSPPALKKTLSMFGLGLPMQTRSLALWPLPE